MDASITVTITTHSLIKNWTNPYHKVAEGQIDYIGALEQYQMAQRYLNRYPLLSKPYYPTVYSIQTTQIARTASSANSFAYGLFQGTGNLPQGFQPVAMYSMSLSTDTTLRFFDNCHNYLEEVVWNKTVRNLQ